MGYRAVIFDMDGTLLNTLEDIAGGVNYTLQKHGYPVKTLEEVRLAVGNGAGRLMKNVLPQGAETLGFDKILKEYEAYYQGHCQIKTGAYPGIRSLLESLKKRGVLMAIVSNKGDGAVKELNRRYFPEVIQTAVGERPGIRRKPEPDAVLEALQLLGVSRQEALYVGDSEVDYHTARRAAIHCALVTWGFRRKEDLEQLRPDYLVENPKELLEIVVSDEKS